MSSRSRWPLWRDWGGLAALAAGSLGIGLTINRFRLHPLPLGYVSPKQRLGGVVARMSADSPLAEWQIMDLGEFERFVSAHRGLSVDARPGSFYEAGHVPGALSLPRENFEQGYAGVREVMEPAKELPVVVYCSEADCQDSELVVGALGRLGYRHLFVYKEGWEEWSRAGLPRATGRQP